MPDLRADRRKRGKELLRMLANVELKFLPVFER
jgi:hypothetical protein